MGPKTYQSRSSMSQASSTHDDIKNIATDGGDLYESPYDPVEERFAFCGSLYCTQLAEMEGEEDVPGVDEKEGLEAVGICLELRQ
jgi:hypothetical protein